MSTESIWTVISNDQMLDRQRELIDAGDFSAAKKIESDLKFVGEKCKALIDQRGGTLHISTLDRQVLETSVTIAADMPNILEGFKQLFGSRMAVGMGLTMAEAAKAAWISCNTNQIEMYDPADPKFDVELIDKSDDPAEQDFILPPNLFDPVHPKSPKPDINAQSKQIKYKAGLNAQQSMEAENMLLQAIVEQLGGGQQAQEQQQQMMQQMQQQAQQQPENLAEALHGGKLEGQQGQEGNPQKGGDDKEETPASAADGQKDAEPTDGQDDKDHQKLGNLLAMFNDKIPQLMGLADTNPDAFKQVISLVHKVVDMAKKNKNAKAEAIDYTQQLEKAVSKVSSVPRGAPIGTVHNRKKKVMVNGKAMWRSVISGQVKDAKGNAISVRSSNANADGDAEDIGKETKKESEEKAVNE